jgi:hypothetical protein
LTSSGPSPRADWGEFKKDNCSAVRAHGDGLYVTSSRPGHPCPPSSADRRERGRVEGEGKVAFFRGASLRPLPPGESKQKEVRYLDIRADDALDEKLVASWIRQASELPGWVP